MKSSVSTTSLSSSAFEKPLNNCDKMTPELPLAPIKRPLEKLLPTVPICFSFKFSTSCAPDDIDRFIFVPVSPSGTGKTFNEST